MKTGLNHIALRPWIDFILILSAFKPNKNKPLWEITCVLLLIIGNHYYPHRSITSIDHPPFRITNIQEDFMQHIIIDCYGDRCNGNSSWKNILYKMPLQANTTLEIKQASTWHDALFFTLPKNICRRSIRITNQFGPSIIKTHRNSRHKKMRTNRY